MSRPLEPALLSLLPTYSTALPQPLLELASSLLAQSRHNAATLKPEEEVARLYACAHLACERLKISLDLPDIHPRPPIPPRVYNRLYTHLDNVLPSNAVGRSGRVRTPSSKLRGNGIYGSGQRVPSRGTPSKDEALAKFRSPAAKGSNTPTKSSSKPPLVPAKRKAGGVTSALPAWVRPTILFMCKELDEERIGKTVFAGIQTIAAPQGERTGDRWVNDNLTALVAAIYFMVSSHLYVLEQGKDLDNKQYARLRKSTLKALEQAPENVTVTGMDEDEIWIGWTDIGTKDIDQAVSKIVQNGWQNHDWFSGIKYMAKTSQREEEHGDVEMEDGDDRISEKLHVHRSDTMFQSRWDMTEEKRAEYREWKEGIMQRIEEIQRSGGREMEVDAV